MKRPTANLLVDAGAFAAFVLLTATGILVRYVLPPGSGRYTRVMGLDRHGWGNVHFWISVVFLATLALHLILHWKWIVCVVKGRERQGSGGRVALAVVGLLGVMALAAAPFLAPLERAVPAGGGLVEPDHGEGQGEVRGSMTLREVAERYGISLKTLRTELGLPQSVDADERIGRLSRSYNLTVADVRRVVQHQASARP